MNTLLAPQSVTRLPSHTDPSHAMTPYLLDTNTVSHLIKAHPQATERLLAVPIHSVCISAITAGEQAFDLQKDRKQRH